jgi:PAS domain S-box-containing protein
MAFQQTPYTIPVFLAGVLGWAIAAFAFRHRDRTGAKPMAVFMAGVGLWSFAEGINLLYVGIGPKLFWGSVEITSAAVVVTAYFLFVVEFTGHENWITRRRLGLLLVEPIAITVCVFFARDLVFTSAQTRTVGSFQILAEPYGPAFLLHTAYAYGLVAISIVLLVRVLLYAEGVHRTQSAAILFAGFITTLGNALWVLKITPIDTTVFGFRVGGSVITATILRRQLLEAVPITQGVARDAIFEEMADPVIVLDSQGTVTELNPAAVSLLDVSESAALGEAAETVLPAIEPMADAAEADAAQSQLSLEVDGEIRYYDVRNTPLRRSSGAVTGRLLSLRDVTTRRQQRQRVDVLNRLLRHNLRNEMNVITGNAELLERELSAEDLVERVEQIEATATEIATRSDKVGQVSRMVDREGARGIDLAETVRRVVADLESEYPEAAVRVDVPEHLVADVGPSVEVAIEELLVNAIVHTGDDATVAVSAASTEDGVELAVDDDGPGIDEYEFEVLSAGRETALKHGSGVGLWVVNWVVEQFGGRLEWETDDGSTVRLHLPGASDDTAPSAPVQPTPSD